MEKLAKVITAVSEALNSKDDAHTVAQKLMTALEVTEAHQEHIQKIIDVASALAGLLAAKKSDSEVTKPDAVAP